MNPTATITIDQQKARADRLYLCVLLCGGATVTYVVLAALSGLVTLPGAQHTPSTLFNGLVLASVLASLATLIGFRRAQRRVDHHAAAVASLHRMASMSASDTIRADLAALDLKARHDPLIASEVATHRPRIIDHLARVLRAEQALHDAQVRAARTNTLRLQFADARTAFLARLDRLLDAAPAIAADMRITQALAVITQVRRRTEANWDQTYARLSWWQKLTLDPPDMSNLDTQQAELATAHQRLIRSGEIDKTRQHFAALKANCISRLDDSETAALQTIPPSSHTPYDEKTLARTALWLSAMSIPVSAWSDVAQAGSVYDTLREVNGNYADMSDADIWLSALTMPAESLAGLVSLTKGAHFEKLVESATGGARFEQFNHPDTDIMIDGIAYQIKATDSESYIDSVADNIPVISTTEVAAATGAIDGGYTDAEVTDTVELALGGGVIDLADTATDAVLTGLGGLGILATLRGINHAAREINDGGDAIEAVAGGVGVAVTGTAKAMVDTAELGYKVLTSRPSRFVGRVMVKVGAKVGRTLTGP